MSVPEHVLVDHASFSALPVELVEALNQTYFLHLLVTDPQKIIPPGKSLLSMLTHANFRVSEDSRPKHDNEAQIADRVKEVAHKAFWNEALELLSSPLPSVQLPRLKRLYLDMYEALTPLFPPNHRILVSLSSPLSPTSSPLHSTINLLKDVLVALRQRCAPVRDQTIDDLLFSLECPPESSIGPPIEADKIFSTPLAEFVVNKIKAILTLAEDMKTDLNTFVLGSMTEDQLQGVLLNDVKVRERDLVLRMWRGKDRVRELWRSWVAEVPSTISVENEKMWISRLFRALEGDQPIHCTLPSSLSIRTSVPHNNGTKHLKHEPPIESNAALQPELPPQLFFSTPSLLYIQNYLQAIVIAAALRSLTRLPPSPPKPSPANASGTVESDFMTRIWALLKSEIDDDAGVSANDGPEADAVGQTKLINLADEVVRARERSLGPTSALGTEEEKRLRVAVERTLRSNDPVFLLLKKRLVGALEKRLLVVDSSSNQLSMIPVKMQTGKDLMQERAGKRPRLMLPRESESPGGFQAAFQIGSVDVGVVPGFEETVLQKAILEVLQKAASCVGWVEGVWGDLV
ncbi:hypothetical protein GALMADRAFT_97737 [Galerina marginata CBS 339.88]|uniref:Uncharacterized protein n=1 Tax=Galerina marginata (strain CBS 339.88) TaxID=685588 RepID=A0A067T7B9_GALM3|nr:hypothetical protein GALMADRAFT_97737 [Galerina marginata CBS 339.88]